jgi:hypothetical protein
VAKGQKAVAEAIAMTRNNKANEIRVDYPINTGVGEVNQGVMAVEVAAADVLRI